MTMIIAALILLIFHHFVQKSVGWIAPLNVHKRRTSWIQSSDKTASGDIITNALSAEMAVSIPEASEELIFLLLQRSNNSKNHKSRIEFLMEVLERSNAAFDPETCLSGPLFAVLYQKGPVPFWEQYGGLSFGTKKNIKGQRYMSKDEDKYELVNYAEFLGNAVSIKGCGACTRDKQTIGEEPTTEGALPRPLFLIKAGLDAFAFFNQKGETKPAKLLPPFFGAKGENKSSVPLETLLKCPVDYTITMEKASVSLFNSEFALNAQGTGYMRVLYADPKLQILTIPKDTTDERWKEKAGLTVAQVRVDLLDPSFHLD